MSLKRKRGFGYGGGPSFSGGATGLGVLRINRKRRRTVVPGVTRTGGYYGRYNRASGTGELKFHDVDVDDAVVATGGTIQNTGSINLIAQDTTEVTRIGRKCTIKSIHGRVLINLPTSDANATPALGDSVRYICYVDKQCNGATAAVTDILESSDIHSFRNLANSGRFLILKDKLININYAGLASDGAAVVSQGAVYHNFSWNTKCNLPLEFSGTAGALTEIRSNNIGIMLVGNSGTAAMFSKMRLRFSDGA